MSLKQNRIRTKLQNNQISEKNGIDSKCTYIYRNPIRQKVSEVFTYFYLQYTPTN